MDYVEDFYMFHRPDIQQSEATWNKVDEGTIEATTARSILVSHPTHDIKVAT